MLDDICIGDLYCLGSPFPVPACLFCGNGYVRSKPASFSLRRAAAEAILAKEPPGDNLAVCCRDLPCRLRRLGAEHLASGEVLTSSTLGTLASCSKDVSSKQGSLLEAGGVPPRVLSHPYSHKKLSSRLNWRAPALILSALQALPPKSRLMPKQTLLIKRCLSSSAQSN